MNTDTTWQTFTIESESSEATEKLAEQLGQKLKGGEVVELTSDLGGGKTTFVRGLARGAGSSSHVSSPTFKISNIYKAPKFDIAHYDFYRLPEAGLMRHELADVLDDPKTVVVVEWSDVIQEVLPTNRVQVRIETVGEDARRISIRYPLQSAYLIPK